MKKVLTMLAVLLEVFCFTSCEETYYEPVFGLSDLPAVIPASGGRYKITYQYDYYDTKASCFEWECRVIVDGKPLPSGSIKDFDPSGLYDLIVDIPANNGLYPRSVMVEASTHVKTVVEDWWGDWTPIASCVQNAIL